jgi:hypothetical protein
VADGLDKADELALVGRQFEVSRCHWVAKEGDWPIALVYDHANPRAICVALNDEL